MLARVCALSGGVLRLLVYVRPGLWVPEEQRGGPWWAWVTCDDGWLLFLLFDVVDNVLIRLLWIVMRRIIDAVNSSTHVRFPRYLERLDLSFILCHDRLPGNAGMHRHSDSR